MTVKVDGYRGVAFYVREVEDDRAKVVMVGDDRVHDVDVDDCEELDEEDYCHSCGQVGCTHDGLER